MTEVFSPFRGKRALAAEAAIALMTAGVLGIGSVSAGSASVIDATTLKNKVLFGYQGWFDCPLSGGGWTHWSHGVPAEGTMTVDAYPDLREFKAADLCPAGDFRIGAKQAYLFTAKTPAIVDAHFRWMQEYGLDGVYIQRFVGETSWKRSTGDVVLKNAMKAAAAYGRVFAIEYDVSGASDAGFADAIKKDWMYLVDSLKVATAPGYLHENGKPVVSVWGIGFTDNHPPADPAAAAAFIAWFKTGAAEKYRIYYMGGTPSWWRPLNQDARTDPAWKPVYKSMDAIQPWAVGRYGDSAGVDNWKKTSLIPDLAETKLNGNFYVPVVFPGFSWKNLNAGPANQIPRKGGKFLWRQAMNAKAAGAEALKIAMFDEVDEGTAMFKIAPKRADAPDKGYWLTLDADGLDLPADWYLRLAGEITKVFHGTRAVTDTIPIRPGDPMALIPRTPASPASPGFKVLAGRDGTVRFQAIPGYGAASAAAIGNLLIRDPAGRLVRTLALVNGEAQWDCRDDSGRPLGFGLYLVQAPGPQAQAMRIALP
ncbi:MAG: hypothetical protein JWP91_4260 [Fibrobacteres bacterium]|nr:hypothetical protein [Fibrobacterota bacterium]